jgi:uncharacterized protein YbjT (DUF2867 family)
MSSSILITGATGRLGRIVTKLLLERGERVRAFTRRPAVANALFGSQVEIAVGDFDEVASLDRALTSVDRVLLLSPISSRLVRDQIAVIDAAERHGVERIVKISGSDWTIDPPGQSISGDAHARVEAHLEASLIENVSLRPNGWMQVSLPTLIAQAKAGQPLYAAYGEAGVGMIDARDIAAVAVHQLLATRVEPSPLVLTGGAIVTVRDITRIAAHVLHRHLSVTSERPSGLASPHAAESFEGRAVAQFMTLIRSGRAAQVSDTVPRLLGRAPRTAEAFIAEQLEILPA